MKLKSILLLLSAMLFTQTVPANDNKTVATDTLRQMGVSVKIYTLDNSLTEDKFGEVLINNQPEYSPGLIVEAGKTAGVSITNPEKYNDIDKLQVTFNLDDSGDKYAIDFNLYHGETSSTSAMNDIAVGEDLIFSAELNGASKLIQVKTIVMEGSLSQMLAKNELAITPSRFMYEEAQQYFQEDKIWDQDLRRYKDLKKHMDYQGRVSRFASDFFYLTNHDSKRLIKGSIKIKGYKKTTRFNTGGFFGRIQYTGLRNFTFTDELLHFVILPNQSVLLGHWDEAMQLEIVEADFLSTEETTKLRAEYEKNNKG